MRFVICNVMVSVTINESNYSSPSGTWGIGGERGRKKGRTGGRKGRRKKDRKEEWEEEKREGRKKEGK